MSAITIKELLEAGVHFGHQAKYWNPKMKKYIFGERNGIYIIDLQQTVKLFDAAYEFVKKTVAEGESILFIGTKRQAQDTIEEEAGRSGMFFVVERWLGGMLTNFQTIKKSINKLNDLERMKSDGTYERLPKRETIQLEKQRIKLEKYLAGIRDLNGLPGAVFIVDIKKERIGLLEAKRLGIPVIGVVDTNCDPEDVDFVVPGNDDAIRSIKLLTSKIADAVLEGKQLRDAKSEKGIKKQGETDKSSGTMITNDEELAKIDALAASYAAKANIDLLTEEE